VDPERAAAAARLILCYWSRWQRGWSHVECGDQPDRAGVEFIRW
jgi:hypothetical protein